MYENSKLIIPSNNLTSYQASLTRERREEKNGHKSLLLWFTGLSGAGKSTIAHAVEEKLYQYACHTYVLDGDNVRQGLNKDLGFSDKDREENIRRIGEVAKLFLDAGIVTLTAFISPFRADRKLIKDLVGHLNFIEIYCHCPLEVCEKRDVKGLYKKARLGLISNFTGISSPYEEPLAPELTLNTARFSIEVCAGQVITHLLRVGVLQKCT